MDPFTLSGPWLSQLNEELNASDRACAVLAGAILDDRLLQLLKKFLHAPHRKGEDKLLGRGSPLESFAARIELARRLNLVAPEVSTSLDWVRDIRNDAAHREQFSFSEDSVGDRVANIVAALELHQRGPNLLTGPYATRKGNFVACAIMLVGRLQIEYTSVKQAPHQPVANALVFIGA